MSSYKLLDLQFTTSQARLWGQVTVMHPNGQVYTERAEGRSVISCIFRALDKAVGVPKVTGNSPFVESYEPSTKGPYGPSADCVVTVRLRSGAVQADGTGTDDCIVTACALAYLDALNQIVK